MFFFLSAEGAWFTVAANRVPVWILPAACRIVNGFSEN